MDNLTNVSACSTTATTTTQLAPTRPATNEHCHFVSRHSKAWLHRSTLQAPEASDEKAGEDAEMEL